MIILDIFLPQKTGFELLVEMKDLCHNIPVILITDFSGNFKANQIIEAGADGYITRPFCNTQIAPMLKSLASGKQAQVKD